MLEKEAVVATTYQHQTTRSRTGNGQAIAALVLGIVGLVLLNYILGPLAIIFGGVGLYRANHGAERRGMSITGIILGIVDLILWGVLLAVVLTNGHHHITWHIG